MVTLNTYRDYSHLFWRKTNLLFGYVILTLLASAILMPRVSLVGNMLTLDDIIPLLIGGIGALWVFLTARFPKGIMISLLLAWVVIGLVSSIANGSSLDVFAGSMAKGVIRPLNSLLILVTAYQLLRNSPTYIHHTLRWIVWIAMFQGALGVISYGIGVVVGGPVPELGLAPYGARGHTVATLVPGRFQGTTNIASNYVGAYFVMTIPLTLALALTQKGRWKQRMYLLGAGLQGFGLLVTFTRASLVVTALLVFGMAILLRRKTLIRLMLGLAVILGVLLIVVVPEYLLRFTEDTGGVGGRVQLWMIGLRMMLDHPLFGVGFNQYMATVEANPILYPAWRTPHNSYIMLGAEGGVGMFVVGVLTGVVFIWAFLKKLRAVKVSENRIILVGLLAGGCGFLLQGMTNNLIYIPHLTTYFWLYYALGMALPRSDAMITEKDTV